MLKKMVFISFLFLVSLSLYATEHTIFEGKCWKYNSVLESLDEQKFQIRYDDKEEVFYFLSADWLTTGWIYLSAGDFIKLRAIFSKYFEWEDIANKNDVTLQREIPDSSMTQRVTWKYGSDWYSSNSLTMRFTFFSQSKSRHQLVLKTNKARSTTNQFIEYEIEGYYYDHAQVRAFYDAISEDSIAAAMEEIKKQKDIESLFK